jgi:hypothetical protein
MPCVLEKVGPGRFRAPVGSQVTLEIRAADSAAARLIEVRYDATHRDSEPPFQFNVKRGLRPLVVLHSASKARARLTLVEVGADGAEQTVERWTYSPASDARGLFIDGV